MKIALASDLHFEFYRADSNWLPPLPSAADILVLAGDIDVGDSVINSIQKIADSLPNTDIVFVAGNHEYYNSNIDTQIDRYREVFSNIPRVHFLENDQASIKGYTFLGCTLWSGFNAFPEYPLADSARAADNNIPDFKFIKKAGNFWSPSRFSADDARERFLTSKAWLSKNLAKSTPEKTIVVTHFPPHTRLIHGTIPASELTNYFVADCRELIEQHQPKLWVYGHNHWTDELQIGNTKLVSNQLGYPGEQGSIPTFNGTLVEEL